MEVFMDNSILRKRLMTFKSSKGNLIKVSDELLFDVIRAWESWTGTSTELARELGIHVKQLSFIVRKAKKLHREGRFPTEEFKEIKINPESGQIMELAPCSGVELVWSNGKVIRFSQVDLLVDFLKKAA
jgi:hypothetical protein